MIHIYIVYAVGIILVVIGIAGLFLPFLQGFLILALGLFVISFVSIPVKNFLTQKIYPRYPRLHAILLKIEIKTKRILKIK